VLGPLQVTGNSTLSVRFHCSHQLRAAAARQQPDVTFARSSRTRTPYLWNTHRTQGSLWTQPFVPRAFRLNGGGTKYQGPISIGSHRLDRRTTPTSSRSRDQMNMPTAIPCTAKRGVRRRALIKRSRLDGHGLAAIVPVAASAIGSFSRRRCAGSAAPLARQPARLYECGNDARVVRQHHDSLWLVLRGRCLLRNATSGAVHARGAQSRQCWSPSSEVGLSGKAAVAAFFSVGHSSRLGD